ncbi:MAG: hypothetical protein FD169_1692 [Bacillota bacterium]|nr:MAG: hypothetical protein FD169_1692 [Bacillota bacterium]
MTEAEPHWNCPAGFFVPRMRLDYCCGRRFFDAIAAIFFTGARPRHIRIFTATARCRISAMVVITMYTHRIHPLCRSGDTPLQGVRSLQWAVRGMSPIIIIPSVEGKGFIYTVCFFYN